LRLGGDVQTPFEQQPPGHEAALHTQVPPTHCCPATHAGVRPQRHAPPAQVSAFEGSHVAQVLPPAPQLSADGVRQTLFLQQPVGHEVASHTHAPPTHRWPRLHALPAPHMQVPLVHVFAV
jgi:hypothetical protein